MRSTLCVCIVLLAALPFWTNAQDFFSFHDDVSTFKWISDGAGTDLGFLIVFAVCPSAVFLVFVFSVCFVSLSLFIFFVFPPFDQRTLLLSVHNLQFVDMVCSFSPALSSGHTKLLILFFSFLVLFSPIPSPKHHRHSDSPDRDF